MIQSLRPALKMFLLMLVLLGIVYPLFITVIAQITMPKQAGGSLIQVGNKVIGSELIAQQFKEQIYFWPRPSATDFDPLKPAGGSNLGPTSQKLKEAVEERVKRLGSHAPADLVYASGSGLDPHILLETAFFQVERVAKSRSIKKEQLDALIHSLSQGFEVKYVNVLMLNMALDQQFPLDTRSMAGLQRADPSDRDEFGALAPDEERYDGDASVIQPESGSQWELLALDQQFPLDTRSMAGLQRADPSDRDEFGALAPDEERYEGDASVIQPESGSHWELLAFQPFAFKRS